MPNWLTEIEWAIALRSDLLTPVFKAFSTLGYGEFLLLLLPLGYWIFNKNIFARLGLFLLFSALLNAYVKDLFQDPRPDLIFQLDPYVGQSYGFPSGHAQMAIVAWFWLAWKARKTWIWILSSVLVTGICFSRLYLGVHDMEDILGGLVLGVLSLFIFALLTTGRFEWWHNRHPLRQIAVITGIETLFFLTWPGKPSESVIGLIVFMMGFCIGIGIQRNQLFFQKHRDWWKIIVFGGILIIAIGKGFQIETGTPDNYQATVVIILAFVNGVYLTALAPWTFQHPHFVDRSKYRERLEKCQSGHFRP